MMLFGPWESEQTMPSQPSSQGLLPSQLLRWPSGSCKVLYNAWSANAAHIHGCISISPSDIPPPLCSLWCKKSLWWMALTIHWISYSLQVLDQIGHQHCRHKNICSSPKHSRHGYCSKCPQGLLRLLLAINTDCKSTGAPVFARRWNLCFYLVTQSSSCRRASTKANSV
jgi:hypothetical protein